jgi:hypothetical protein
MLAAKIGRNKLTSAQIQTFQMPFESNNDEILKISDNFSSPNGSLATSTSSSSLLLGKIQNFTYDMLESTKTQPLNIKESGIEYYSNTLLLRFYLPYNSGVEFMRMPNDYAVSSTNLIKSNLIKSNFFCDQE